MALFGSDPFDDPRFGRFVRKGGMWTAECDVAPFGRVAVGLAGDRRAPAAASLDALGEAGAAFEALRGTIGHALVEHLAPYREAIESGDHEVPGFAADSIRTAADVWPHTKVVGIDIDAARAGFAFEVQLAVAWDEEHTLGARFDREAFFELNGSVVRVRP